MRALRSRQNVKQRSRLALILVLCICAISSIGTLIEGINNNLLAIDIVQQTVEDQFSWTDLAWWTTHCLLDPQQVPATGADGTTRASKRQSPISRARLVAMSHLNNHDCVAAISTLEKEKEGKTTTSTNDLLLAHLYVMSAAWEKAAAIVAADNVMHAQESARRFWANVYYRIGVQPSLTSETQTAWLQEADRLSGVFPLDGSIELASYLAPTGPLEAFDEFRRATSYMSTDEVLALYPMYISLRSAAVAESLELNPVNPAARRLNERYSFDPNVDNSTMTTDSSEAPIPRFRYSRDIASDLQLVGFDVDPDDLRMGPLVRISVHWCNRSPAGCYRYVTTSSLQHNLIGNSSFELDPPVSHIRPFGFYVGYYGEAAPYPYEIVQDGDTQALCLRENQGQNGSGIITPWRKLEDGQSRHIVLGGTIKTEEPASPYFGLHWRSTVAQGVIHVDTDDVTNDWASHVSIIEIPNEATEIAFHVLRQGTEGVSCFDDLFAFFLPKPPTSPGQVTQ